MVVVVSSIEVEGVTRLVEDTRDQALKFNLKLTSMPPPKYFALGNEISDYTFVG